MGICRMCVGSLGHSVGSTMRNDDSEATRARPARTLVVAFALLIALALSGCDEEFCIASNSDPGGALLQGLLCLGNRPPSFGESPTASFTVAPGTIDNGGAVVLDASASSDPDGRIVRYQWDVDGVPDASIDSSLSLNFELDARDQGVTRRQIFMLGGGGLDQSRVIGLRVTDDSGKSAQARQAITILGSVFAPVALFTFAPSPAVVGQSVLFDASSSFGARSYEWDLDGNGTFEVGPSPQATTSIVYATSGARAVRLRITDAGARTATTVKEVPVFPSGAARASAAAKRAPGRAFSARLAGVSFPSGLGTPRRRGGQVVFAAVRARGRLIAPRRGLGPLRPFRRSTWVARLRLSADPRTARARLSGLALATFTGRSGRACLRITMATRTRGAPTGTLKVIGGTGAAARLAGGGRFRLVLRNGTPRLDGRLDVTVGKPRPLPRRCSRLRR